MDSGYIGFASFTPFHVRRKLYSRGRGVPIGGHANMCAGFIPPIPLMQPLVQGPGNYRLSLFPVP